MLIDVALMFVAGVFTIAHNISNYLQYGCVLQDNLVLSTGLIK